MKVTKELARDLSEEMLAYEIRMNEIAELLDSDLTANRHVVKASERADGAQWDIFQTRNILSVAFGNKLNHRLPAINKENADES